MTDLVDLLTGTPGTPAASSTWWWGVVTSTAPLRVRLEPDTDELPITPTTLVALAVDDRVWCQLYGVGARKQLIVHGKAV